jgi:hypothetical protein
VLLTVTQGKGERTSGFLFFQQEKEADHAAFRQLSL